MAERLSDERLTEIKQRAGKAPELRGSAVDIDQCYKDRAALVAHIAAQDARHDADVAALQEIARGVEADQAKIAALQAQNDEFRRRLLVLRDSTRKAFGLGLMPWLLDESPVSETAMELANILSGWHAAESSLAETREKLAQADAVIADGLEEAQMREYILTPEEYEAWEGEAIARHSQRQTSSGESNA